MEHWLRTDEYEEAVSTLEMVSEFASTVCKDKSRWKWVIIALHNAFQGFMVLALRTGNGLAVLTEKNAQAWLNALENNGPYPEKEKLDTCLGLYKKIKNDKMFANGKGKKLVSTQNQDRSVEKLNQFRNEFIHFVPKGWSIEVSGFPGICLDCLEIIKFLALDSENIRWDEQELRSRCEHALSKTESIFKDLKERYT